MKWYIQSGSVPVNFPKSIDEISGIYLLTADMIAKQITPALLAYVLQDLGKVTISLTEFTSQPKEWQADFIRLTMMHKDMGRSLARDAWAEQIAITEKATAPPKPVSLNGEWVR